MEIGRLHDGLAAYPDPASAGLPRRYYRTRERRRTAADDWKNQIEASADAFLPPKPGFRREESRWIKFAIRLDEPHRVYYQDSAQDFCPPDVVV